MDDEDGTRPEDRNSSAAEQNGIEKKQIQGRAGEIVGEQLAAWAEKSWLEKESKAADKRLGDPAKESSYENPHWFA